MIDILSICRMTDLPLLNKHLFLFCPAPNTHSLPPDTHPHTANNTYPHTTQHASAVDFQTCFCLINTFVHRPTHTVNNTPPNTHTHTLPTRTTITQHTQPAAGHTSIHHPTHTISFPFAYSVPGYSWTPWDDSTMAGIDKTLWLVIFPRVISKVH
jgi:hypothetical protein